MVLKNVIVFCLALLLVLCFVASQEVVVDPREFLKEGDQCVDGATGEKGLCTPTNYCLSPTDLREENATTCLFGKDSAIVCCLERDPNWVHPDDRTVSQKKCLEYNKDLLLWDVDTPSPQTTSSSQQPPEGRKRRPSFDLPRDAIIFGGTRAFPEEFPHMAALGWPTVEGKVDFKCGGTLVSELFVLTAAHCTAASSRDTEVTSVEPTVVRLGALELNSESPVPSGVVDAAVRRIVQHPAYKSPALYNDIALVEMETPLELNSAVRPACLWYKNDINEGQTVSVTGWGITSQGGERSNALLEAELTMFSDKFCQPLLQHLQNRKWKQGFSPEQICAGDLDRKHDSCRGDSGGPLQMKLINEPFIFYVVGITSFGDSCPAGSGVAVYTRVSSFVPWIESIVWPDQTNKKKNVTTVESESS